MLVDIKPKMLKCQIVGLRIIGIHGHAGCGKDTLGAMIQELVGVMNIRIQPFAAPLKHSVAVKYGFNGDAIWGDEKEVIHPFWGISSRQAQQFEGTEGTRDIVHPDFWLARFIADIDGAIESNYFPATPDTVVVVPDVRFQNEYDLIVANNGLIVDMSNSPSHRPITNGIVNHRSESKLNLHAKDQTYEVINDSDLDSLREKASWILEQSMKHRVY